jgi:outer membrane protein assembly factor BamB
VANPAAPTLVVLDKNTGRLVARDDFNLGVDIIHGQWCSPALGQVAGRTLLFLGTGKGYLFAFEPAPPGSDRVKTVWSFNGHPLAQTQDVVSLEHGYETKSYEVTANPVFHNNRIYVAFTQDPWHTGITGWFTCIDAAGSGDLTRKGLLWRYDDLGRCISTASIADGLVYVASFDGKLHCLDAETGKPYWVHDAGGPIWSSTLVADGRVYLGTGRQTFWILRAGKTLDVIRRIRMRDEVNTTPVAANGTLYVATTKHLYAVGGKK